MKIKTVLGMDDVPDGTEVVLRSDYDAKCAELAALREDAERYLWLRDNDMTLEYCGWIRAKLNPELVEPRGLQTLDAAIDAARTAGGEEKS